MRLYHISGDRAVFLYDHTQPVLPRVGDNYYATDVGSGQSLVVQVVALETFEFPSLGEVLVRQLMEESYGKGNVQSVATTSKTPQVENLGQAIAKIRRLRLPSGEWRIWNGWLPSLNVQVEPVDDEDLFRNVGIHEPPHPLRLGTTLSGQEFSIAGKRFEKVNVITALKGMGKSHLAKVIILELIREGMPCVVFDLNQEYVRLPALQTGADGRVTRPGVLVLAASENFRVTIDLFGKRALIRLFEQFNPTDTTRNEFEVRVGQAFDRSARAGRVGEEQTTVQPFINLDYLRGLFNRSQAHVRRAILDRLEQIEALRLFAETEEDVQTFTGAYESCLESGGALVIDLSPLPSSFAREAFVGATLDLIETVASKKPPFVFFEEAHLYTQGARIDNLVTRARHLGITSTFVTNMVTQLDETVLRQVDNLFLLYLPYEDDIRHVAKSATTDEETIFAFAQRIEQHHALAIGSGTGNYPIVFRVATPQGIDMAGQTYYAFSD